MFYYNIYNGMKMIVFIVVLLVFITDYNVKWYHNMKMFYPVLVIQFRDNIGQT